MNWELWVLVVVTILLLVAGGYIKRLVGDIKNLVDVVANAIEDGRIDDAEIALIIRVGRRLGESIREITRQILGLIKR